MLRYFTGQSQAGQRWIRRADRGEQRLIDGVGIRHMVEATIGIGDGGRWIIAHPERSRFVISSA